MSEIKYIVDNLLSIESFNKLLDQYGEVIEDIRKEKSIHSIVGVVIKHIDDSELKGKFEDMLFRQDEINEQFSQGIEGMMTDPDDPKHTAAYEEYKKALDHYLIHERPSMELEILKLAYEKLKNDPSILKGFDGKDFSPLPIPKTKYPNNFIISNDKVTNKLFDGELPLGLEQQIGTENYKSKKELTAVAKIEFDELEGVTISKSITPYDREVHDAIVSLFVDGGNQYLTPLMIYRTMTGNPKAKLTPKQHQAISESVTRCSMARIRIDAKDEAEAFNMQKLIYEGNLLYTKKVIGEHNGKVDEWICLIDRPILYDYANNKGQVTRAKINLLNTPVSKNEETVVLQGYLLKRILIMKGNPNNPKVSKNIVCETIYKQLNIQAASPGALRKKQTKIRDTVREILKDWIEKEFIKDYRENIGKNKVILSFAILLN